MNVEETLVTGSAVATTQPRGPLPAASRSSRASALELRRLSSLLDVSKALAGTLQLRSALCDVLDVLVRGHEAGRAFVMLRDDGREDRLEASDGFSRSDALAPAGRYGRVAAQTIESGRIAVTPSGGDGATSGDRIASPRPTSAGLTCVPILCGRRAVGALGVEVPWAPDADPDRTLKFYRVVASMIGQAIKIQRLVEDDRRRLQAENSTLRQELRDRYDFSNIIGSSRAVQNIYEQLAQVAATNTTVLIRGESGTGKELIAHAIHYNSLRANKPFVKVSCAALPDTLIESELFGHERGAFTDAVARKKGRFEIAEGGTLFLDEIGEINLSTQIKLLRVLQQREFERLGGTDTIKANVRVIAATNKDLERAIAAGTFREDLYYRLNVFAVVVPPLRERKTDLPELVAHFLEKLARTLHKPVRRMSPQAIDALMSYHWPGNIRELENVIERAMLVCDGRVLHPHHLPPTLQTAETSDTVARASLKNAVATYERELIQDAIKTARGNRAKAARLLGTTERIITLRVKQLQIDCARYRP